MLLNVSLQGNVDPVSPDILKTGRRENQLKGLIVTQKEDPKYLLSWDRREFGPNASFRIERVSEPYLAPIEPPKSEKGESPLRPVKVPIWLPITWTLTVRNGSFPGNEKFPGNNNREFNAVFTFKRDHVDGPWWIFATITRWWGANASVLKTKQLALEQFLSGTPLSFRIDSEQNQLLKSLFHERIEARSAFDLQIDHNLDWVIDAGDLTPAKRGRLYTLDIPLEFGRLKLTRIRSDLPVASAQSAAKASADAEPPKQPGQVPPNPGPQPVQPVKNRRLFEAEAIYGRPLKPLGKYQPDGLYGAIDAVTGFTAPDAATSGNADIKPIWAFDIATKRKPDSPMAIGVDLDAAAVIFGKPDPGAKPRTVIAAAIRHWGYPVHTVAGCVATPIDDFQGIGRLNVRHGPSGKVVTEGPFEFAGFELVRQQRLGIDAVVTRLSVQPVAKETTATLQIGAVCVAGLPAISAAPGAPLRVPAIVVTATEKIEAGENERRFLSRFSARLALTSAAIALPDRIEPAANGAAAVPVSGKHVTRLGFHGADVVLYLPALGSPPVSSADALIPVGPAPVNTPSAAPAKAVIDLGRAHLSVLRPSDLLALKFRFSGLELVAPWPPAVGAMAELAPRGGRSPGRPFAHTASATGQRDERPMLVVEFPPQHVMEKAYFKQIPTLPDLPELIADPGETANFDAFKRALSAPKHWSSARVPRTESAAAKTWREWVAALLEQVHGSRDEVDGTGRDERIELRRQLRLAASWPSQTPLFPNDSKPEDLKKGFPYKTQGDFDGRFTVRACGLARPADGGAAGPQRPPLPEEQRLYVGAEFLDVDARRIAWEVLSELKQEEDHAKARLSQQVRREAPWPSADFTPAEWATIFDPLVRAGKLAAKDVPEQNWPGLDDAKGEIYAQVGVELQFARERRSRDYLAFREMYRELARQPQFGIPDDQKEYLGPLWLNALPVSDALAKFKAELRRATAVADNETFDTVVPARLSGPSRIAFRVDCEDYESDRPGGRIPFTLEGLTNWGGMDMAVVRRAERLMEPLRDGRLPPRWGRRALNDEGAILRFQGFTPSDRWSRHSDSVGRERARAAVMPAQRLAEVYATSSREPDTFETAIELPFRLFLSPAQDATWMTSAPRVRRDAGLPEDVEAFRELWTARLTGSDEAAGLRAVWSPDYRPEALLSTDAPGAPPIGAYAPWALPRSYGVRQRPARPIERFRTGLESFDRHELVILSSIHGLPVLGRRAINGELAPDANQIDPPAGFRLQGLQPYLPPPPAAEAQAKANQPPANGRETPQDLTAIYRPKPLSVTELSLSALGGNLDIDAVFQPPAAARAENGRNLFDALSIERWRQRTVLGRDIVVEVVYKGFLFPLGHRASLVKLTERRFMAVPGRESPVAILVQRQFLRVGKPEKRFQAEGQPNRASRWPCDRVTILTRQSPDLVDARNEDHGATADRGVYPRGTITFDPAVKTTGLCMWPRTAARRGAEVWFEMQIGDEAVPVRLPLIFIDNLAANDDATVAALVNYYNNGLNVPDASGESPTKRLLRNGQPVVMAPEYKPGDTTFDTQWWRVTTEGRETTPPTRDYANKTLRIDNTNFTRDAYMEGQDQPPFYPVIDGALCRLKSVEQLTGSGPLWAEVGFDGDYVENGFVDPNEENKSRESQSEIFLRMLKSKDHTYPLPLNFEERGDLAGGFARAEMLVIAYSRILGPINGTLDDAPVAAKLPVAVASAGAPNEVKAGDDIVSNVLSVLDRLKHIEKSLDIIPKGKFLGIMELSKLVEAVLGVELHPKLLQTIEYGAASAIKQAVDGAADAAADAASDVRSGLTKALLAPLSVVVAEVETAWHAIAQRRLAIPDPPTLDKIYPRVGADIAALRNLLISAQQPETSDPEFFEALAAIHQAARRLTRTIDAIARDPLAAAAGAQVELFKQLLKPITDIRTAIDKLSKFANLTGTLRDGLKEIVESSLRDHILTQTGLTGNVIAIPVVAAAVKAAISPPEEPWSLNRLAKLPRQIADNLRSKNESLDKDSDAHKAIGKFSDDLSRVADQIDLAVADARQTVIELGIRLKEADDATRDIVSSQLAAAQKSEQAIYELALDILLARPVVMALRIADQAAGIWAAIPNPPLDRNKLVKLLVALSPILELVVDLNQAKRAAALIAGEFCAKVKKTLDAAVASMLPPIESATRTAFDMDAACRRVVTTTRKLPGTCEGSSAVERLHKAAVAAKAQLNAIDSSRKDEFEATAVGLMAAMARIDDAQIKLVATLKTMPPDACVSLPGTLMAEMRAVVLAHRVLIAAVKTLEQTIYSIIETLISDVGKEATKKALRLLVVCLDEAIKGLPQPTVPVDVDKAFSDALMALAAAIKMPLPDTAAALRAIAGKQDRAALITQRAALAAAMTKIRATADTVVEADAVTGTMTGGLKSALQDGHNAMRLTGEAMVAFVAGAFENDLYTLLATAVAPANDLLLKVESAVGKLGGGAFGGLVEVYNSVIKNRDALKALVDKQSGVIAQVLDTLARKLNAGSDRTTLFFVYPPNDMAPRPERLVVERDLAKAIATASGQQDDLDKALLAMRDLSVAWRKPALGELLDRFKDIDGEFARAVVVEALDLRVLRSELDRIIRELVPTKATLSYDLSTPVRQFEVPTFGKVFLPVKGTRLEIKTRASIDLLNPKAPEAFVDGHMGPFGIQLFGNFDVVLLNFRGLDFRSGAGRPSGFDVRFGDFVIGDKAKFLKELEPFVSPKSGLPPVRPMKDKPGIEASYGINLGSFGVGTLSFSNVTLNAGARLPFGSAAEAEFIVSIGRTDAPFLISSTIFGGGGYLALLANGKGFIGLETSFDYGGVFTFGFGPLTGTGQITLGLYFRAARGEKARLGMNFMCRGAANIACFSFSTSLFVRLTYVDGKMDGTASYTFSFSIGIDDIDFKIEVYVNQGSGAGQGSPTQTAALDLPGMPALTQFAGANPRLLDAYASSGKPVRRSPILKPALRVVAPSQQANWRAYRELFDPALQPVVDIGE